MLVCAGPIVGPLAGHIVLRDFCQNLASWGDMRIVGCGQKLYHKTKREEPFWTNHAANDLHAINDAVRCPLVDWLGTTTVQQSMISSGIRKSLQIHGLGKLVSAFAVMGLFTEEDFSFFSKLNVINLAPNVRCNSGINLVQVWNLFMLK